MVLFYYLAAISAVAVVLTVYDKAIAGGKRRRIPEAVLFAVALLGGSGGMYLTMLTIRHKTLHKRFMLGLPAILAAQVFLYVSLK